MSILFSTYFIIYFIIYSRIIAPGSKRASLSDAQTFSLFNSNENEQPSMTPLEQKIIKDFDASDFIVCTDAGLSSTANRKFNSIQSRKFVTTQSVKKLNGVLQDFCLGNYGWYLPESRKTYKLSELDEESDYDRVFFKNR